MMSELILKWRHWQRRVEDVLFPQVTIYARTIPWRQELLLFAGLTSVYSLVGVFLPTNVYVGWDWVHTFSIHKVFAFYPPWTYWITDRLNWPLLTGLTLAAYTVAVIRRSIHPISAAAAFLTLPLFWTAFLGQLEGLVAVGLLWLPWLAPFALVKPQVSFFAFLSRKSFVLAGLVVLLLSLLIWGAWPVEAIHSLLSQGNVAAKRAVQDISLGVWAMPLALVLMWLSTGDMDMLMLAGAVGLPYLLSYHLMPVTPAIARLKPGKAIVAALLSWLPFSANWLGPGGWWLGWLFVAWLWGWLAIKRYARRDAVRR